MADDRRELALLRKLDKGVSEKEELSILRELDAMKSPKQPSTLQRAGEKISEVAGAAVSGFLPGIFSQPILESAQNTRQAIDERSQAIQQSAQDYGQGKIGLFQAPVQMAGQAAGGAFDVLGESMMAPIRGGFRALPEDAQNAIRSGANAVANTDVVQGGLGLVRKGMNAFNEFEKANPQEGKTVRSAANLLLFAAPTASKTLRNKAAGLKKAAKSQVSSKRQEFVKDLIMPEATKKNLTEQAARTTEKGVLSKKVIELSPREKEIASEVTKIKTLKPGRIIHNRNEIDKRIGMLNSQLEKSVKTSNYKFAKDEAEKAISNNVKKLVDDNPFITSDSTIMRITENVQRNATKILGNHEKTPLGVLKARKEFDSWVLRNKPKAFDGKTDAFTEVVRNIRRTMNDMVDTAVPNASVKSRLKSQNLLLEALDNIGPKVAVAPKNAITRTINNLVDKIPIKNSLVRDLAGLGIVSGGVAATISSPAVAYTIAGGITLEAGRRVVVSPTAKKAIAAILKATDKALLTSKKPSVIRQLRADRAVLVNLLSEDKNGQ